MNTTYYAALEVCKRHADRLTWAMTRLRARFPLSVSTMRDLDDTELAVLDQFSARFSKLQDCDGYKIVSGSIGIDQRTG